MKHQRPEESDEENIRETYVGPSSLVKNKRYLNPGDSLKQPKEFQTRPLELGFILAHQVPLTTQQVKAKRFYFDDVGEENISDEEPSKNNESPQAILF